MDFSPHFHIVFDILAFVTATVFFRRDLRLTESFISIQGERGYWIALVFGAISGAFLAGSVNLSMAGIFRLGHSIAGALAGGIVAVELYKLRRGYVRSTGFIFVASSMAGIAVGRLGCFFSGLEDETYGLPTQGPLGVDFGDGVHRHPVQLYESLAMLIGLIAILIWRRRAQRQFREYGFYVFIFMYAGQRFCLEFLKPYPEVLAGLNVFHFICIGMVSYSLIMIGRVHAQQ